MAKSKKNKRNLAEKVRHGKSTQEVKNNPFEIRINRQKHHILGKKISKHAKGLPGVSRSKAIKKRKDTLLKEYQQRHKANKFIDKRFGENDPTLSVEEKMMQRFAFERQRTHSKEAIYQLNEEEELTHYGQSLADVEKFEDTQLASDDEEDDGNLGAKYVAEEHFGGFLTRKKAESTKEENTKPKSRQEILDEVIANSKKDKYERQHQKEDMLNLTEKLNKDWQAVSTLISFSKRKKSTVENKPTADDYDVTVRELMFDMKAKATDRMKTPEEVAREAKQRLDKLEQDRQRRMLGITEEEQEARRKVGHQSADDLNDGYALEAVSKTALSYKDGKPINMDMFGSQAKKGQSVNAEGEDQDDDNVQDDEEEDDENDEDGEDEGSDDTDNDDEFEDNHSDLESDDAESDSEEETSTAQPSISNEMRETIRKSAKEELPYTFKAPGNYEEFMDLVGGQSHSNQFLIVERIRTCHHPSLAKGNKDKLDTLLTILLRYFGDVVNLESVRMEFLDGLTKHIYELTAQSSLHAGQCMQALIADRHQQFEEEAERRGRGVYPGLDMLLYFKLVGALFSTSDFRHAVVTPAMLFMGQILSQCPVRTYRDVASGLFVCSLFLKYIRLSKRFVPEVINHLRGLLFLAADKEPGRIYNVIPPFKPVGRYIDLLRLQSNSDKVTRNMKVKPQRILEVLSQAEPRELETDEFRCWALHATLSLLSEFATLYAGLASAPEIFDPVRRWLEAKHIPVERYPEDVEELHGSLLGQLTSLSVRPKPHLQREKKRPQPLPMFEPKIEEDYDPVRKKRKNAGSAKNEKQRLLHNYKREMKGAIREIRKDAQFLAREKIKEQMERDSERKEKVKRIHQLLAGQEGDYQATKRGRINLK
ncbi:nucleolar protein 14-like [Acanthaster planci]|uniref:Nucleolar protein 14-like n=1 Tax=Acanthaster planci TaxID=133434 RepID=A0A8B7ZPB2_ACAPL|nr:nucleolar protein 14-like [Acanthaster planci]XP_022106737.1 nucleolar protein 14-like [Acanthaster planci]XP_022106738.1 nucleolar protein 14-like [Acanthaster planci]XP_022106739.1 nucleolar protein 14-like [Acanthaster planci]XP_022106740.1 nucleolar protein 14-like [Acanthaster planci]XP_022106741.1 nucleolar protein 14-like [Acanthaster planci]